MQPNGSVTPCFCANKNDHNPHPDLPACPSQSPDTMTCMCVYIPTHIKYGHLGVFLLAGNDFAFVFPLLKKKNFDLFYLPWKTSETEVPLFPNIRKCSKDIWPYRNISPYTVDILLGLLYSGKKNKSPRNKRIGHLFVKSTYNYKKIYGKYCVNIETI